MDNDLLEKFKNKLKSQKREAEDLLRQMERNDTIKSNEEFSSELSAYDNHPADSASSLFDKERGLAFQKNEEVVIEEIDNALKNIERGTYGICKGCGMEIDKKRLEYVPYAEYCSSCQRDIDNLKPAETKNRPSEEDVIEDTMENGCGSQTEFDAEDSYQAVGKFNGRKNIVEEYTDEDEEYVEPVESISNEQYKNQLP